MEIPIGIVLKEWKSYVTNISRNLMELSEQTDVKIIKIKVKDNINGYTGQTKIKAMKATEDLDTLWRYYALLSGVIDKAEDLYSKDSFFKDTEGEVKQLLENTPITLGIERIDINNRSLLGTQNKEKKVTLKELLEFMQESFETTRNTFKEIASAAEGIQNKIDSIKNEISSLNSTALHLGLKDIPSFDIAGVTKISSDPLQGVFRVNELLCSVKKYRDLITAAQQQYYETNRKLKGAESMLCKIEELAEKSEKAALESKKIFDCTYSFEPIISVDVLKSLHDWLDVLKNKLAQGYINAASIGALRLERECNLKLEQMQENYYSISKDYNEWLDLKGEFSALLAKLDKLKMEGVSIDNSLNILIENTRIALNADKVNLDLCRGLIEKFHISLKS